MPIPTRVTLNAPTTNVDQYSGFVCDYPVILPNGVIYLFYINSATNDPGYIKSTDYGVTWGSVVALKACAATYLSVWYDGWSGITATSYIHCAYTDSGTNDTFYRTVNTASADDLGTERTVFAGSSQASYGTLSVVRARGGNVYVATCIDAGAEYDFRKTTDLGANWTSPAEVFEGATSDQIILMPGFAADNQDIMAMYWDASADEISVKFYDDSGNTWSETSLGTSMVDVNYERNQFAAAVDYANSRNILVAWNAHDTANADLRCWLVSEGAQTEVTNVVLNGTNNQSRTAIAVDSTSGMITVFYGGKSDGTEDPAEFMNIYYKFSLDAGTTWSAETLASSFDYIVGLMACPVVYNNITGISFVTLKTPRKLLFNIPISLTPATTQLGG